MVNKRARIGKGTIIQHRVTIGSIDDYVPTIGHNVFIGAGAIVIGGIKVGDNSKIGAGALVISDVPENCTVVGVPAKIVNKKNN